MQSTRCSKRDIVTMIIVLNLMGLIVSIVGFFVCKSVSGCPKDYPYEMIRYTDHQHFCYKNSDFTGSYTYTQSISCDSENIWFYLMVSFTMSALCSCCAYVCIDDEIISIEILEAQADESV